MFESTRAQRRIGRFAWVTAWSALVVGQLHALARHRTEDGKGDLEAPLVRAWSDPARDLISPLLDWGSPDTVYLTYGKFWLPVFLGFTLCAYIVRRRREPVGIEQWCWRIVLAAYSLACVAVFAEYWTQWGAMNDQLLDALFLATIPVVLVTILGSSALGVVLVRRRLGFPAVLLALTFPLVFAILAVTSLGNVVLPIAFAFGILGRRISHTTEDPSAADNSHVEVQDRAPGAVSGSP